MSKKQKEDRAGAGPLSFYIIAGHGCLRVFDLVSFMPPAGCVQTDQSMTRPKILQSWIPEYTRIFTKIKSYINHTL
jgi:hypothetical protein